jgi:hypothetical protein
MKNVEKLYTARVIGSNPIKTSAGRPAAYCKVQTISHPDLCKCKTMKATEIDRNHAESSLYLNTINVAMGSWKPLLGTTLNAPRDLLPQSSPNTSFAVAGDAVEMDAEVLRIVLAKAHNPLLHLVYPEVQSHDLMKTSIWRQSTFVSIRSKVEAQFQTSLFLG